MLIHGLRQGHVWLYSKVGDRGLGLRPRLYAGPVGDDSAADAAYIRQLWRYIMILTFTFNFYSHCKSYCNELWILTEKSLFRLFMWMSWHQKTNSWVFLLGGLSRLASDAFALGVAHEHSARVDARTKIMRKACSAYITNLSVCKSIF